MSYNGKCPIWGTPAIFEPKLGDYERVNSPRAGGAYWIDGTAISRLESLDNTLKAQLTSWLVEQRQLGIERPEITAEIIEQVMQRQPLPVHERADRLLKYLADNTSVIGSPVILTFKNPGEKLYGFDPKQYLSDRTVPECLAWSESLSEDLERPELIFLLKYLVDRGWIIEAELPGSVPLVITVEGYTRLAELATKQINASQGFVAMWFDDSMTEAYEKGIAPGIEDAGYSPLPINRKEHINKIDDEIIAEIRRSRFVVADFTHGVTGPRGGVYYEAGFAHGLGIPIFFTCRKDVLDQIHFDTRQYNHIVWTEYADLRKQLANRISAVIGDNPNKTPKAE